MCEIYIISFLAGNRVFYCLFYCLGKCGNAWKLWIYDGLWIPRKRKEICWLTYTGTVQYSLGNLYIINYISPNIFLSVNTNSGSGYLSISSTMVIILPFQHFLLLNIFWLLSKIIFLNGGGERYILKVFQRTYTVYMYVQYR
jgi:hypothetical protein